MAFGDLKSDKGVKALNDYLADRSYIEGLVINSHTCRSLIEAMPSQFLVQNDINDIMFLFCFPDMNLLRLIRPPFQR